MKGRLLMIAAAIVAPVGCGEGQRTFTASEFVGEMNDEGADLELGADLPNTQASVEVSEIRFGSDGDGTLTVAEDAEGGISEYERCESAATLLCYRAANVVVIFDGAEIAVGDLEPVEAAIRAIAED
ncbi:MAG: hypothetical protein M3355_11490 [Actinomycetota bacterium]|nr:hypothetical protein [Actinomycetota bacterium]